jgi:hypothetical protein
MKYYKTSVPETYNRPEIAIYKSTDGYIFHFVKKLVGRPSYPWRLTRYNLLNEPRYKLQEITEAEAFLEMV